MRIFTILTLLMISTIGYSQLVLVNSPSDIAGSYAFGITTDNGTGTPWSAPALTDSIWTGDAVIMNDTEAASTGCVVSSEDYSGKICLIDRGTCNFSLKIWNAQNSGAIGAIILNNNPGEGSAFNMLGGDSADVVTIPGAFLSYEDGVALKAAIAAGPVNMSMGAIKFNNDLNITNDAVLIPYNGTLAASQVERPELPLSTISFDS